MHYSTLLIALLVTTPIAAISDCAADSLSSVDAGPYGTVATSAWTTNDGITHEILLYKPENSTEAALPVVIYSHGAGLDQSFYRDLLPHLASWGFAVLFPLIGGGEEDSLNNDSLIRLSIAFAKGEEDLDASNMALIGRECAATLELIMHTARAIGSDHTDSSPRRARTDRCSLAAEHARRQHGRRQHRQRRRSPARG